MVKVLETQAVGPRCARSGGEVQITKKNDTEYAGLRDWRKGRKGLKYMVVRSEK